MFTLYNNSIPSLHVLTAETGVLPCEKARAMPGVVGVEAHPLPT
jgi:hypothetical protein